MRVIVVLVCVFAQLVYSLDTTPLLVIDFNSVVHAEAPEGAPFAVTSPDFIRLMLQKATNSKMVLFFIEETLSAEDLSIKDEDGTPYSFLRDHISQLVKYYPRVSHPVELMNKAFPPTTQVRVSEMDSTTQRVLDSRPEYLYVSYRDDVNEPRVKALRRHDAVMKKMYFAARRIVAGPVVAFYTGKMNPTTLRTSGAPRPPSIIRSSVPKLEQMQVQSIMVVCPVMLYDISIWFTHYDEVPLKVPIEVVHEDGSKIMKTTERIETVITPIMQNWSCSSCLKGSVKPSETHIDENYIYAYIHKYTESSNGTWDCWTLIFVISRTDTQWTLEYLTVFHRNQDASDTPKLGPNIHFEKPVNWGHSFKYNEPLYFNSSESLKMTIARFEIEPIIENIGKKEHERRHYFYQYDKETTEKNIISNMNISVVDDDEPNQSIDQSEPLEMAAEQGGGLGSAQKKESESSKLGSSKLGSSKSESSKSESSKSESSKSESSKSESSKLGSSAMGSSQVNPSKSNVGGSEVFITPGILSGLIVIFIIIVPLLISIKMLMDVGENNRNMRFDERPLLRPEEVAGQG